MTSMQQRYHVTGFFWYLKYISTLILLYFYFILNAGFANKLVYLTLLTRRHMTWPNYTDASIFHPHLMGQIIAGTHFTTNSLIFMLQKQRDFELLTICIISMKIFIINTVLLSAFTAASTCEVLSGVIVTDVRLWLFGVFCFRASKWDLSHH